VDSPKRCLNLDTFLFSTAGPTLPLSVPPFLNFSRMSLTLRTSREPYLAATARLSKAISCYHFPTPTPPFLGDFPLKMLTKTLSGKDVLPRKSFLVPYFPNPSISLTPFPPPFLSSSLSETGQVTPLIAPAAEEVNHEAGPFFSSLPYRRPWLNLSAA